MSLLFHRLDCAVWPAILKIYHISCEFILAVNCSSSRFSPHFLCLSSWSLWPASLKSIVKSVVRKCRFEDVQNASYTLYFVQVICTLGVLTSCLACSRVCDQKFFFSRMYQVWFAESDSLPIPYSQRWWKIRFPCTQRAQVSQSVKICAKTSTNCMSIEWNTHLIDSRLLSHRKSLFYILSSRVPVSSFSFRL